MDLITNILFFVGIFVLVKSILPYLYEFLLYLLPMKNLLKIYGSDSWAIVTGATDGLGKAFAEELAKLGFNLIIISRNNEKLRQVKENIIQYINKNIQVQQVEANFDHSQQPNFIQNIINQFSDKNISLLVNNVGILYPDYFLNLNEQQLNQQIIINCTTATLLSQKLISIMKLRKNRSAIINVSSLSADVPTPFYQVYGATKAFNKFLTNCISFEYNKNIDIMCLKPGFIRTKMINNKNPLLSISANECAYGALRMLGKLKETCGHPFHILWGFSNNLLPDCKFHDYLRFVASKKYQENLKQKF